MILLLPVAKKGNLLNASTDESVKCKVVCKKDSGYQSFNILRKCMPQNHDPDIGYSQKYHRTNKPTDLPTEGQIEM